MIKNAKNYELFPNTIVNLLFAFAKIFICMKP